MNSHSNSRDPRTRTHLHPRVYEPVLLLPVAPALFHGDTMALVGMTKDQEHTAAVLCQVLFITGLMTSKTVWDLCDCHTDWGRGNSRHHVKFTQFV